MHDWSDENYDWQGLDSAIRFIETELKKGRVSVFQAKEKFGTARIYCTLGWHQFHCITHPGHAFSRYPKLLWVLDCQVGSKIIALVNKIVLPYHKWLYREVYYNACMKYPHLIEEICCCADYEHLLDFYQQYKKIYKI